MKCVLFRWTVCACVAISGALYFAPPAGAQDDLKDKAKDTVDKAKEKLDQKAQDWHHGRIQSMLTTLTQAAAKTDGFESVVNGFNDADRDRIKAWINDKNNKDKLGQLSGRINQFRADWKAKYGSEFEIKDHQAVWGGGNFMGVALGEIGQEEARLAGEKIPAGSDKAFGGDANLNKGRNIAYLTVNAEHSLPALKLPLIHEMPDTWKLDVPNAIDGNKLAEYLNYHFTKLCEHKDKWPGDSNQALRLVGHHVLMACVGATQDHKMFTVEFGGEEARGVDMTK